MKITLVLGTGREGRLSEGVAKYLLAKIQQFEPDVEFLDIKDLALPFTTVSWMGKTETAKWQSVVEKTQGFVFVVPEYNRSFPGEFKNLLDQLTAKEYIGKPVVICGVSSGGFGAVRMFQSLLPILHYLNLPVVGEVLSFSNVKDEFSQPDYAKLDEKYLPQIEKMVKNLLSKING